MSHPHPLRRAESFSVNPPRNISAPFQNRNDHDVRSNSPTKVGDRFEQYEFAPLEKISDVTFEKYCGPTPESNWVIPNALLVGAYPASQDDAETFELVTSILKQGITKFVCLQQEYRSHGITEDMWRNGQALRPYFEDVKVVVKMKDSIPELTGYNIVSEDKLSFVHFPIKDCGITDDSRVLELARSLVKAIHEKEVIYLHCWGGHGRTGTLVCIMLHLMYGLDPVEAMSRCQFVHDLRQCPVVVGSPQTQPQRDQVTRIINRLMSQNGYLRRTVSDISLQPPPSPGQKSPRSGDNTPVNRTRERSISKGSAYDGEVTYVPVLKALFSDELGPSNMDVVKEDTSTIDISTETTPTVSSHSTSENDLKTNDKRGETSIRNSLYNILKTGSVTSKISQFEKHLKKNIDGQKDHVRMDTEIDSASIRASDSRSTTSNSFVGTFRNFKVGSKSSS